MTQVGNEGEVRGPFRRPVNGSAGAKGSIHDDATAQKLGFRGGTVAGSIHMDQFPPMLVEAFGSQWFETGSLSLQFRNATVGGEAVQVILGSRSTPDAGGNAQVPVRVEREDGLLVAEGTAGVGASQPSAHLDEIDLRPAADPSELRMFSGLPTGTPIDEHDAAIDSASSWWAELSERITEPLDWYAGPSPWGGAIVSPSAVVQLLWQKATASFGRHGGGAVGLFGAIEIRHHRGPVFLDQPYRVTGEIVAVGHSPKTEYVWFDTQASDDEGVVASMRMQLRWMKASSKAYAAT